MNTETKMLIKELKAHVFIELLSKEEFLLLSGGNGWYGFLFVFESDLFVCLFVEFSFSERCPFN